MEEATLRGYIYVERNSGALTAIQSFLASMCLYNELKVFEKTGGRSGDMGEESINFEIYCNGSEGGYTDGMVNVYSLTVDNTNGFGQVISVTAMLPNEKKHMLKEFLEGNNFAGNHSSFRELPSGFRRFRPYWDECVSHLPGLKCFHT